MLHSIDTVVKKGVLETFAQNDEDFIKIASTYGSMIKSRKENTFIDKIIAQEKEDVIKDSLSKRFGMMDFPAHTDGAYLKVPPQFILMRYIGTSIAPSPTIVVHFELSLLNDDELNFINNAIYYVKGSNGGFYSKIFDGRFIRYDSQVMKLASIGISDLMNKILDKMPKSTIHWQHNKVAIINNWKTFHLRPALKSEERRTRILQRINIL